MSSAILHIYFVVGTILLQIVLVGNKLRNSVFFFDLWLDLYLKSNLLFIFFQLEFVCLIVKL